MQVNRNTNPNNKMESSNKSNTAQLIGVLMVGVAIGATLGVLFAPDKGSTTRAKISQGAQSLAEELKDKVKAEAEQLQNQMS